jgi:hypothetical protein
MAESIQRDGKTRSGEGIGRKKKYSQLISLPSATKGLTVPRPMDGIFDPLDRVK